MRTEYNTSRRSFRERPKDSFSESGKLTVKKEEKISLLNQENTNDMIAPSFSGSKDIKDLEFLSEINKLDNNLSNFKVSGSKFNRNILNPISKVNNKFENRSLTPNSNSTTNFNNKHKDIINTPKTINEMKKKGTTVQIRSNNKSKSKEKSLEDNTNTTNETTIITLSSGKTRKTFSTPEDTSNKSPLINKETVKKSFTFRESLKVNNTNSNLYNSKNSNSNNTQEDERPLTGTLSQSNKNGEPIKLQSKEESEKNISYNNYSSNNYSNSTTPETSAIRPSRTNSKIKTSIKKPFTPPDNKNLKLPAINNNFKRKYEINNDINNIFQNASNFKEDPIIKKKLDDIIQNIADIKNVLNQKSKSRLKISSAPNNNKEEKFAFSPNKNTYDDSKNLLNTLKDDKNVTFSKFNYLENNTKVNSDNNNTNHTTNNLNETKKRFVKQNSDREKLPIKLIKK